MTLESRESDILQAGGAVGLEGVLVTFLLGTATGSTPEDHLVVGGTIWKKYLSGSKSFLFSGLDEPG